MYRSVWCSIVLFGALGVVLLDTGVAGAQTATWSIYPSPDQGSRAILNDTSCTGSTNCVAVGEYLTSTNSPDQNLVESWNGTSWSIVSSPNEGSGFNQLNGVSCTSSTNCVAVGDYFNSSNIGQTLVETWNGTSWSITPSPNPSQGSNSGLDRVSCTSSTNCVAVGSYNNSLSVEQTLVETWNGTSWSIVSSPNEGSGQNALNGVSCTSSTNCVAVGFYVNSSSVEQTLAETWNGTSWSIISSPNEGSGDNGLGGVSCTSSTNCVAVGIYAALVVVNPNFPPINVIQTLVETWNGTSWSIVSSPNEGTDELNELNGVSCTSSTNCVAVGSWEPATSQTLVETWNGTSWSITPSPSLQGNYDALADVSCTSSTNCVTVGYDETSLNTVLQKTLIETTGMAPPVVTAQPTDQSVGAGGRATFTAAASGNPSPTVQWQNSTDGGSTWSDISGATSTTYTIASVTSSDIGNEFRAVFTNGRGSATTNAATLDPPTTSVLIPSNGTTLSGSTYLDASASNATSVKFLLFGGIYGYNAPVLCTAISTEYGWLCSWNTSSVPNGSYVLVSQASNSSGNSYSSGVSITINNPTTSVLIPSSGTTLSGSTYLDASASNATSVEFRLFGGSYGYNAPVLCTATTTAYGWLCSWNTTTVPNGSYALLSEAFGPGGSAFSSHVSMTVKN